MLLGFRCFIPVSPGEAVPSGITQKNLTGPSGL